MKNTFRKIAVTALAGTMVLAGTLPASAVAKEIPITKVSFPTTVNIRIGETKTLDVKTFPENTTYKTNIEWGSQKNGRFTNEVNGFGTYWNKPSSETITGVKAGTGYLNTTVKVYDSTGKYIKSYKITTDVNVTTALDAGKADTTGKAGTAANKNTTGKAGAAVNKNAAGKAGAAANKKAVAKAGKYVKVDTCYTTLNSYRTKAGVKKIRRNATLEAYAKTRAKELVKKYSHTRPNGKQGDAMISWNMCGVVNGMKSRAENIARGQASCAEVMKDWYHSAGHRNSMLSKYHTQVGIAGYEYNGMIYWVQLFAS